MTNHCLHLRTLTVGPKHQTATLTAQTQRDRPVSLTFHLLPTAMSDARSPTAALLTAPAISPALVIRPPIQPFNPTSDTLPKIWFRHLAYHDRENKLLVLYGFLLARPPSRNRAHRLLHSCQLPVGGWLSLPYPGRPRV